MLDPTNPTIALQLGQLQEKIGMFLGALETYQRILALDNPGAKPLPHGLYRRSARREWERSVRIAKYRQLVLLGGGTAIREWCGPFEGEPWGYRKRLRDHFGGELEPLTVPRGDPTADAIAEAIKELIKQHGDGNEALVLSTQRDVMPLVYQAGYELQRGLSRVERRPWRQPLTRRTVGLTLASLRMRAKLADIPRPGKGWPDDLVSRLDTDVRLAGWRPGFWAGWRPSLLRRWTWQQHYNAACLYAIPLGLEHDRKEATRGRSAGAGANPPAAWDWPLDDKVRQTLARDAVDRLERAASRADSDFVAARRAWVLEEDHDLRGLRDLPEFKAFAADYFPSPEDPSGAIFGRKVSSTQDARLTVRDSQARIAQTRICP